MTIELWTWNTPNGRKISVALEEMGLPYKVIPINISEGGAILIYLVEKTGKFWPKGDLRKQVPVLEWLMWQMGGFGPMPGQVHHFLMVKDEADRRYGLERYSKETHRLYGVFDKRLGEVPFAA